MKISQHLWKEQLAELLTKKNEATLRLGFVGIGSELNGDDAVGMELVQRLRKHLPASENMLLVEAGTVPENFTGVVRKFKPDLSILIDAGDFGAVPGEVCLFDWRKVEGFSASTHSLPLSVFASKLESETGSPVLLLAIQPLTTEFGKSMSADVRAAIRDLVKEFSRLIAA
jgi:hydrogenase 3 maturation protease